jgi:hypothetical protein
MTSLIFIATIKEAGHRIKDKAVNDLPEVQTRLRRGGGKAGIRGEAGIRIDFEHPGSILCINPKIDASISPESK